jgi:signal transduction histidine kinase
MALTKRHVERLNGKVEFRSVERQGSEFTVTLPADPMPKP